MIAEVNADDYGLAVDVRVKIRSGFFLPLCGRKMIFGYKKRPVKKLTGLWLKRLFCYMREAV